MMFCVFSKRKFRGRNHLKTTWLVTPKDNWPPIGKSGALTSNRLLFFDRIKITIRFRFNDEIFG